MTACRTSKPRFLAVLFAALFAAGLSCSCADTAPGEAIDDEEPIDMSSKTIPPWYLWGGTKTVELIKPAVGTPAVVTQQLAKFSYGRPESWNFLFVVQVLESPTPGGVGIVQIRYNLTTGIGRTQSTIDDFELYIFDTLPFVGNTLYSSSVKGPLRTSTDTAPNMITDFVGQDMQLNARAVLTGPAAPGSRVKLNISAYFAPITHIRPEWFDGNFRGGEDGGT